MSVSFSKFMVTTNHFFRGFTVRVRRNEPCAPDNLFDDDWEQDQVRKFIEDAMREKLAREDTDATDKA